MIWERYRLDDNVLKVTEDLRLWQTEKGFLEIKKDALAVQIMRGNDRKGYVLRGQSRLLLDTIIETDEGALGRSVERDLSKPFLILGTAGQLEKCLAKANQEDFAKMGYGNQQGFIHEAEDMLASFSRGRVHCDDSDEVSGSVFAFLDDSGSLDNLIVKGSKLVYRTRDMVFVANGNRVVLRNPGETIVTDNRRCVVVKDGQSLVMRKC